VAGGRRKKVDRSSWRWMGGASRTEVESSTEDRGPTQVGRKWTEAQEIGVGRKSGVDRKQRERLEAGVFGFWGKRCLEATLVRVCGRGVRYFGLLTPCKRETGPNLRIPWPIPEDVFELR